MVVIFAYVYEVILSIFLVIAEWNLMKFFILKFSYTGKNYQEQIVICIYLLQRYNKFFIDSCLQYTKRMENVN